MAAKIVDLLTDETQRLQLAKSGRKIMEERGTWTKVGGKIQGTYPGILTPQFKLLHWQERVAKIAKSLIIRL